MYVFGNKNTGQQSSFADESSSNFVSLISSQQNAKSENINRCESQENPFNKDDHPNVRIISEKRPSNSDDRLDAIKQKSLISEDNAYKSDQPHNMESIFTQILDARK